MSSAERDGRPALAPEQMARGGLCIGCGACAGAAPPEAGAAMRLSRCGLYVPGGAAAWRRGRSGAFARQCPFSAEARDEDALAAALFPAAPRNDRAIGRFEACYVGHVREGAFRASGSSGGLTSWTAVELLRTGRVDGVAHVAAVGSRSGREPLFRYRISRSEEEIRAGAKSRYYPVELSGVLAEIRAEPGRYAVVGVPCFVKAIQLLRAEDPMMRKRIVVTLGLFCGHMKSGRLAESFAWQMGVAPDAVDGVDFRHKDPARPASWYTAELTLRSGEVRRKDWWSLVDGDWGAGFFQSPACDFCDDVVAETADIAFGDAWVEPYASDGRGVSVVVVRSPALHELIRAGLDAGRLALEEVDADFVRRTQAAGLRHRREGLAFRLAHRRGGPPVRKRVAPSRSVPANRRLVYLMRSRIAAWSHPVFLAARVLGWRGLYTAWARAAAALYQGVAYRRGWIGALASRILPPTEE